MSDVTLNETTLNLLHGIDDADDRDCVANIVERAETILARELYALTGDNPRRDDLVRRLKGAIVAQWQ